MFIPEKKKSLTLCELVLSMKGIAVILKNAQNDERMRIHQGWVSFIYLLLLYYLFIYLNTNTNTSDTSVNDLIMLVNPLNGIVVIIF